MHIDAPQVTLIFTIVTGIGVLLQAAVLFGIFLGLRRTGQKLQEMSERLETAVTPLIHNSRGLVEDLSPKIKHITTNLVSASDTLRKQAENVGTVVNDVTTRTQSQTARVDKMISATLDTIGTASAAFEKSVASPLRRVNGMLAGLRAGVDTLRTPQSAPTIRRKVPTSAPAAATSAYSAPVHSAPVVPEAPLADVTVVAVNSSDVAPADVTPEEAREAAARFVRDRAAAASERR